MKKITNVLFYAGLLGILVLSGCGGGGGGNNGNPNRGFDLLASRVETSQTTGTTIIRPTGMRVEGRFLEPQGTIRGTRELFLEDIFNFHPVPGAKVPAKWRFTYFELPQPGIRPCEGGVRVVERNVGVGALEELRCPAFVFPIAISPSIINGQSPPLKIDIEVKGVQNEFGPPHVAILNEFGQLMTSLPATIIYLEKGKIQIDTPNVSQYRNGTYQITVSNVMSDGSCPSFTRHNLQMSLGFGFRF